MAHAAPAVPAMRSVLEYIGTVSGDRFFRGPSGTTYRFGRGANARHPVHPGDVAHFLNTYVGHFRVVPAGER